MVQFDQFIGYSLLRLQSVVIEVKLRPLVERVAQLCSHVGLQNAGATSHDSVILQLFVQPVIKQHNERKD